MAGTFLNFQAVFLIAMNWLVKVAAFHLMSRVPNGAAIYRYCQERLTRSLVPTRERVMGKVEVGMQYWDWLRSARVPMESLQKPFLDFGAGWHPTIPLLFYSLGVERQHLCDVSPILNGELIAQTVETVRSILTNPKWPRRSELRRLPEPYSSSDLAWTDYLKKMGVTYHAPYPGIFEQVAGSVEIATSTQVLLYVPRAILLECFRGVHLALNKDGKFLATIHLWDLHATRENGLSQYNHLRYSPEVWEKWINSSLMSYNRLKAADYRQLLEEAGFQIRHFDVIGPTDADMEDLARIPIHSCFNRYSREELGAKHLFFVAEKV
jgi:hypothetical protein